MFRRKLLDGKLSDEYLTDVMRLMQNEGLIKGLAFTRRWGHEHLLVNVLADAAIIAAGGAGGFLTTDRSSGGWVPQSGGKGDVGGEKRN